MKEKNLSQPRVYSANLPLATWNYDKKIILKKWPKKNQSWINKKTLRKNSSHYKLT